jgi:hypothetical protein
VLPASLFTVVNHKSPQADLSIMGVRMGSSFRITVLFLFVAFVLAGALAVSLVEKASARADINSYVSNGPNGFYPSGHDRPGPAKLVIDTVGWNATRIAGNLGIGNGSVKTFDRTSTYDVEYPDKGFMAGDVSTQPWIPGLKTEPPQVEEAAEENATGDVTGDHAMPAENLAGQDAFGNVSRYDIRAAGQNATAGAENETGNHTGEDAYNESGRFAANNTTANNTTTNRTAPVNTPEARAAGENMTFAANHPIRYLRPVKDILYEHPLSTSGTAYCELLGFVPPAGSPVNVGMKCTGYGY